MKKVFWVVACTLLTSHASAQDYVARAQTTCAAVDGTARYGPCMTSAAQSICDAQTPHERVSCYKDFERYFYAMADQAEAQRRAFKADVDQRIARLSALGGGTSAVSGSYHNPNAGRTLDDGLPDIQPSWGPGGDPYAHLRKYVPVSEVSTGSSATAFLMNVHKATCAFMTTLAEAKDYLNRGATQLDADGDGKPCEEKFAQ